MTDYQGSPGRNNLQGRHWQQEPAASWQQALPASYENIRARQNKIVQLYAADAHELIPAPTKHHDIHPPAGQRQGYAPFYSSVNKGYSEHLPVRKGHYIPAGPHKDHHAVKLPPLGQSDPSNPEGVYRTREDSSHASPGRHAVNSQRFNHAGVNTGHHKARPQGSGPASPRQQAPQQPSEQPAPSPRSVRTRQAPGPALPGGARRSLDNSNLSSRGAASRGPAPSGARKSLDNSSLSQQHTSHAGGHRAAARQPAAAGRAGKKQQEGEEDDLLPAGHPPLPDGAPAPGSLYERLGGSAAVEAAVEEFYQRVLGDKQLAPFFEGVPMGKQKKKQMAFMTYAFGGSGAYSGKDLFVAHKHLIRDKGLHEGHFDLVAGHLDATLSALAVPQDVHAEVMSTVAGTRAVIFPPGWKELAGGSHT